MDCPFEDYGLPEDVKESLLDFAVGLVLETPGDLDAFGLTHFIQAYAYRQSKKAEDQILAEDDSTSMTDSCPELPTQPILRRNGELFVVNLEALNVDPECQMPPGKKLKTKLHLKKLFPFKYLDDALVDKVIGRMIRVSIKAGDTVVRQGDVVRNFFVIESGIYEERVISGGADMLLYTYNWGCFQVASLISPNVARSSFEARTDGVLWAISCNEFRALASTYNEALLCAKTVFLQQLPCISHLPPLDRNKLIDGVDLLHFKKGDFLINGTAESNGLYRVVSGKIYLRSKSDPRSKPNGDCQHAVRVVGAGEMFGDLMMFCRSLSRTRAVAMESCSVLRLSAGAFERLLGPFNKYFSANAHLREEIVKMPCGHWDWLPLRGELDDLVAAYKKKKPKDFLKFGWEYYRSKSSVRVHEAPRCEKPLDQAVLGLKVPRLHHARPARKAHSRQARKVKQFWNPLQLHVQAIPSACNEWGDCLPDLVYSHDSALSLDDLTYNIAEEPPSKSQLKRLGRILRSVPLLKALGDHGIDKVIKSMQLVKVYPGHHITKALNPGSHFYVIEEGVFKTFVNGLGVTHEILDCPEHFGELGLIVDAPRFADVVANSEGKVWALSRDNFRKVADSFPVKRQGLNYQLVKNINGLEQLKEYDIKALSLTMETNYYKDREILCSFEDEPACLFFVKEGTVRVYSRSIKNNSTIIKKGESFGCLRFSVGKSEELKAQSIGRSKVAHLPVSSFEKLLSHCRQVLYNNRCLPPT